MSMIFNIKHNKILRHVQEKYKEMVNDYRHYNDVKKCTNKDHNIYNGKKNRLRKKFQW